MRVTIRDAFGRRVVAAVALVVALGCAQEEPSSAPSVADDETRAAPADRAVEELPADVQQSLEALGYAVTAEPAAGDTGVTLHDVERAQPGLNLRVSMHGREAILFDMDGRSLHTWRDPDERRDAGPGAPRTWWRTVWLFDDGDLLAQTDYGPLVRLDAQSNVRWRHEGETHHDFDVARDGRIFVLERRGRRRHEALRKPVWEEEVVELSADGQVLRRVPLFAAIEAGAHPELLEELASYHRTAGRNKRADVMHTNTLEILDSPGAVLPDGFAGRLLLCVPTIHRLLLLDFEAGRVVWAAKGRYRWPHHPTLTPEGRLLVFDNLGADGRRSRILELDPETGRETWVYGEPPDPAFFSRCCGRVHPLANGNVLVVSSFSGEAFEVTRDRRRVWEFRTPHQLGGRIAILNDVVRVDPSRLTPGFRRRFSSRSRAAPAAP